MLMQVIVQLLYYNMLLSTARKHVGWGHLDQKQVEKLNAGVVAHMARCKAYLRTGCRRNNLKDKTTKMNGVMTLTVQRLQGKKGFYSQSPRLEYMRESCLSSRFQTSCVLSLLLLLKIA